MCPPVVTRLPEDGHMRGRNMYEVYNVYYILSCTYMHLLISLFRNSGIHHTVQGR